MSEEKKRRFKLGRAVSWVANSTDEDIVECTSLDEAKDWAKESALEALEYWAVEIDQDGNEITPALKSEPDESEEHAQAW